MAYFGTLVLICILSYLSLWPINTTITQTEKRVAIYLKMHLLHRKGHRIVNISEIVEGDGREEEKIIKIFTGDLH